MKATKLLILALVLCLMYIQSYSQEKKMNYKKRTGNYFYNDGEWLQLKKDSFKIMVGPSVLYDLDKGDTVLAKGKVEYISENLIKLTTDDIRRQISKSITITESYDETLKDSMHIYFNFPFKGKFEIWIYPYFFLKTDSFNIKAPLLKNGAEFWFRIYNKDLMDDNHGDYLGLIVFKYFPAYKIRNKNTNVLTINIPELTNGFFAKYFINGEYAIIDDYSITWRGRSYTIW